MLSDIIFDHLVRKQIVNSLCISQKDSFEFLAPAFINYIKMTFVKKVGNDIRNHKKKFSLIKK